MVKMVAKYTGDLHCAIKHLPSSVSIQTDAPKDNMGKGETFSPTDLMGAALASCIATTLAIFSQRKEKGWNLVGMRVEVEKQMGDAPERRIVALPVHVWVSDAFSEEDRKLMAKVAATCPVHKSLHPDIAAPITFHWE